MSGAKFSLLFWKIHFHLWIKSPSFLINWGKLLPQAPNTSKTFDFCKIFKILFNLFSDIKLIKLDESEYPNIYIWIWLLQIPLQQRPISMKGEDEIRFQLQKSPCWMLMFWSSWQTLCSSDWDWSGPSCSFRRLSVSFLSLLALSLAIWALENCSMSSCELTPVSCLTVARSPGCTPATVCGHHGQLLPQDQQGLQLPAGPSELASRRWTWGQSAGRSGLSPARLGSIDITPITHCH